MNQTIEYFKQSELALAAYANLAAGVPDISALQDQGRAMSFAQATQFARDWVVVTQYNHISDPYPIYDAITGNLLRYETTTNGLSATVFEEVSTHKRYLAIRGTDDLYDLATDVVSVSLLGTSKFQGQYQSLKSKVQEWLVNGTLPATFTVSGHSLGGFLATGLTMDLGANVEHAYLYNAPGIDGLAATQAVANVLKSLHIDTRPIDPGKFSNLKAEAGLSPIAGLGLPVSPVIPIEIENQFLSDVANPPTARNHSQQVLTDGLAVYALYATLSPTLTVERIGSLLKSASNQNKLTLENSLDALRILLLGKTVVDAAPTQEGGTDNRESFYANLATLQASPEYQSLAGSTTLRVLASQSADSLASRARADFGDFLALNYLLPIAIEGSSGVLGTVHADHAQWQTDQALTSEQRAKGEGNFSDQYLSDRAAFLTNVIQANLADTGSGNALRVDVLSSDLLYFEDKTTGLTLQQNNTLTGDSTGPRYVFGGDGNDTCFSGDQADHLYGGAGMDRLDGGKSNDYIEGNAGSDILSGGEGQDTLLGGAGMDILEGGADDDLLIGGLGDDTYKLATGDGWDWIEEQDGLGHIEYDGVTLTGGDYVAPNIWQKTDAATGKTFTYSLYDRTESGETFKVLAIQGAASICRNGVRAENNEHWRMAA